MEDDLQFHLVQLNLRGTVFMTNIKKFQLFPDSRLGQLYRNGHFLKTKENEYFFDRNPSLFHFILDTYQDGKLHIPKSICSTVIRKELQYWKLEEDILGKCCLHAFYQDDSNMRIHKEFTNLFKDEKDEFNLANNRVKTTEENKKESRRPNRRERIWKMISDPNSSKFSQVIIPKFEMINSDFPAAFIVHDVLSSLSPNKA
ncbi:hypothetical protein FSP39_020760 [Pinctada imbricata]|uniref:Potassium channel tetramerisation-type BTB domain-containing protein n=1 Tax=Pinctada imbricata TaxID=66713 RepID=A0AA88XW93_PINIB|nr:hypothetical protein FSP39_020760 [Pinctada imbricata]